MSKKIEPSLIDKLLRREQYIQKINEQIDTIKENNQTIEELKATIEEKKQTIRSEITKRDEAYEQRNKMQNKLESMQAEDTTTDDQQNTQSYTLQNNAVTTFIETIQSITYDKEIAMTIPITSSEELPFILTEDDTVPIQNLQYIREHAPGILVADKQGVVLKFIDPPLYDYTAKDTVPLTDRFDTSFALEKRWFVPEGVSGFVYGTDEIAVVAEYIDDTVQDITVIREPETESYYERINTLLEQYDTQYGVITKTLGQKIDLPIYTIENHIQDVENTYDDAFERFWETEIHNIS